MKRYKSGKLTKDFMQSVKTASEESRTPTRSNARIVYTQERKKFKDPSAEKLRSITSARDNCTAFKQCMERAATQGLPNSQVIDPSKVKFDNWNSMLLMQWLCRYEKSLTFEDENPVLVSIRHFKRYGEGTFFEFECEFRDFHSNKTNFFWMKYLPLSRSERYVAVLKTRYNWYMQLEKTKHLECDEYNSDDEFEMDSTTGRANVHPNLDVIMDKRKHYMEFGKYPIKKMVVIKFDDIFQEDFEM